MQNFLRNVYYRFLTLLLLLIVCQLLSVKFYYGNGTTGYQGVDVESDIISNEACAEYSFLWFLKMRYHTVVIR